MTKIGAGCTYIACTGKLPSELLVFNPQILPKTHSFWVRMNGGDWQVFHLGISAALKWDVLNTSFNLARGTHTLEVALREDGTGLDEVRLSLSKVAPDSR